MLLSSALFPGLPFWEFCGTPPGFSARLLSLALPAGRKFVAGKRRIALSGSRENAHRFGAIRTTGALEEIVLGAQRGDFLGNCDINELVQGYTFRFGCFSSLVH